MIAAGVGLIPTASQLASGFAALGVIVVFVVVQLAMSQPFKKRD